MSARILIVDDDAAIRTTLADVLGDDDTLEISVAASAEDAIGMIDDAALPDVVFTDLRMKGLDGMDLLRVMRQRAPSSKVVMMTAYHDVGTAVGAMREGAVDFLCKPFDLGSLRTVVKRLLGRGAPADMPSQNLVRDAPVAAASGRPETITLNRRYVIEEELGHGATATVFRAHDAKHDRPVAVKVLRQEVAAQLGVDRFLREIHIAARLHHPHVLTLIDSGEWDDVPYFVTPYVDGPSLRHRIDVEGPMKTTQVARLLREVADALAAAHRLGVVHRDVKPENILFSGRHAWIADFGVARALRDSVASRNTTLGLAIGTPHYMAPEQAAGDRDIDHRADIYAVGIVAYELLTGQPPFTGDTARAILAAHVTREPRPLSVCRPGLPEEFEASVMQCLAKDPEDRWPDAESLTRSFGRFAVEEM